LLFNFDDHPGKDLDNVSDREVGSSSALFPLVGAFQGALLTFSSMLFMKVFPAELTNGLLVLLMAIMTAGLHLDLQIHDAIASERIKKKTGDHERQRGWPFGVSDNPCNLLKYLSFNALFFSTSPYISSLFNLFFYGGNGCLDLHASQRGRGLVKYLSITQGQR
jgi:hypothetical protein